VDQAFVDLFHEAAKQGAGFTLALIIFVAFLRATRDYHTRLEALNKRLEDLLRDRKSDRDALLTTLGRLDAHLSRTDAFEAFAREALRADEGMPKRRALDRLLAEAVERVSHTRAAQEPG
jgi:hypothetical protein